MQTQPSFLLEVYGHTKKKIELLASEFCVLLNTIQYNTITLFKEGSAITYYSFLTYGPHLQLSVLDRDFGPVQVFVKRNFITLLDSLRKLLLTTTKENKICYVDFNSDLLRHEQHHYRRIFLAYVFSPALPHDHKAHPCNI